VVSLRVHLVDIGADDAVAVENTGYVALVVVLHNCDLELWVLPSMVHPWCQFLHLILSLHQGHPPAMLAQPSSKLSDPQSQHTSPDCPDPPSKTYQEDLYFESVRRAVLPHEPFPTFLCADPSIRVCNLPQSYGM